MHLDEVFAAFRYMVLSDPLQCAKSDTLLNKVDFLFFFSSSFLLFCVFAVFN